MNLNCIVCPKGCEITINDDNSILGAGCQKGEEFAKNEIECPKRVLTTTVKTSFSNLPVLPVRTNAAVELAKLHDIMAVLNKVIVKDVLKLGAVVYKDIVKGVDVISTMDMTKRID